MKPMLTLREIKKRFDKEWVLIENPITNDLLEIKKGKVIYHNTDRDMVYKKAIEVQPIHSAILFLGEMPKDTAIVFYEIEV